LLRKLRHRGLERVDWIFVFACAVYNLVRLRKLQPTAALRETGLSMKARAVRRTELERQTKAQTLDEPSARFAEVR
jgi:hypothetical protein